MLDEFIEYLKDQIGEPYCYGCQHTRLNPETYEAIIHKREDGRGGYPDGTSYADAAIEFCRKKFDEGATVLYAYDCSGLGMYWMQNLKHIYDRDANANTLMGRCSGLTAMSNPAKGWWVFRQDSTGKATHIGYMVDDEYLVEAKGRRYGVVRTKFRAKDWTIWGIPDVFYDEIVNPQPVPPEPPTPTKQYVEVVGKSVRIRKGDGVFSKTLKIAHKGDKYLFIDMAPSGWYQIEAGRGESYITNKIKYTKLVEK